jgi:hypothetical protein
MRENTRKPRTSGRLVGTNALLCHEIEFRDSQTANGWQKTHQRVEQTGWNNQLREIGFINKIRTVTGTCAADFCSWIAFSITTMPGSKKATTSDLSLE